MKADRTIKLRAEQRLVRPLRTWVRTEGQQGGFRPCLMRDISASGTRLELDSAPGPEPLLNIRLDTGQFLSLKAQTVWSRPTPGGKWMAGLRFEFEGQLHRRMLSRWINVQSCLEQARKAA